MADPHDIVIVVGTRPEAIKMSGIVALLGSSARVIHTGQHYDQTMWAEVLAELPHIQIREHIEVGGRSRGEQVGMATAEITRYLSANPARVVVVQGDTNSTLAGALAASSVQIPVVHVEAGLRSHDRGMPEEINRILVDAIADLCCAPVEANAAQLRSEGVGDDRIIVTGNTLANALEFLLPTDDELNKIFHYWQLPDEYVLCTIHRSGNVDDPETLKSLFSALVALSATVPVVLPLHPHTRKMLLASQLDHLLETLIVLPPVNPRQFLALESRASLIVSDSGGVQEEAALLAKPLVVLRDSTERPELLDGWCRLLGDQNPHEAMVQAWADATDWSAALRSRPLPYPEAAASQTIVTEIDRRWPAL